MKTGGIVILAMVVVILGCAALPAAAADDQPGPPPRESMGPPDTLEGVLPPFDSRGPRPDMPPRMHRQGQMPGEREGRPRGFMPGRFKEMMMEELGITEEQKDQMRKMRTESQNRTRKARMAVFSVMDEKKTMLTSGNINMEKIAKLDDELVAARTELLREQLKTQRNNLGILTPEQIKKLAGLLDHGKSGLNLGEFGGMGKRQRFMP